MPASQVLQIAKASAGPAISLAKAPTSAIALALPVSVPAAVPETIDDEEQNALALSQGLDHVEDDTKKPGATSASEKVDVEEIKAKRNRVSTIQAVAMAKAAATGPIFSIDNKFQPLETDKKDDDDDL